jgi:prophage maintenance system killer protein
MVHLFVKRTSFFIPLLFLYFKDTFLTQQRHFVQWAIILIY